MRVKANQTIWKLPDNLDQIQQVLLRRTGISQEIIPLFGTDSYRARRNVQGLLFGIYIQKDNVLELSKPISPARGAKLLIIYTPKAVLI